MTTFTTERLITILRSVNGTAIDNDGGKPGAYLAEVCRQAGHALVALVEKEAELTGKVESWKGYAQRVEKASNDLRVEMKTKDDELAEHRAEVDRWRKNTSAVERANGELLKALNRLMHGLAEIKATALKPQNPKTWEFVKAHDAMEAIVDRLLSKEAAPAGEAIPGPAPADEIAHLSEQCSTLMNENRELTDQLKAREAQTKKMADEIARLMEEIESLKNIPSDFTAAVKSAISNFSSPTMGRGDVHGGQRGYIVYEGDGIPLIVSQLSTWLARHDMDRERRERELVDALTRAAEWFETYAKNHRAKGATEKALVNAERATLCRAAAEGTNRAGPDAVTRLAELVRGLLDNDPNEAAADNGVSVIDVWRADARRVLTALGLIEPAATGSASELARRALGLED